MKDRLLLAFAYVLGDLISLHDCTMSSSHDPFAKTPETPVITSALMLKLITPWTQNLTSILARSLALPNMHILLARLRN